MFEQAFKNIDNVLRKEAGCTTELDYTEQTSWLLFLKYLDSKRIADAAAAFAKRFKDQTAAPGTEAALRTLIDGVRAGKPNYDLLSPDLAQITRQNLTQLQTQNTELGALQSVAFKGVGPGGADIYLVTFEKGALEYRIWLTPDGKIDSVNFRKPQ